ncbi:MAG TPA: ABC transporter permease [Saprospiraceae bacterium]|nr:ABC transporter permease [Saprospiraceae bacterium]
MFRNYLLTGIRDLWKFRFFSGINVFGLGISISACLLVIMLIRDAYNYDRFHPEPNRIYRVLTYAQRKGGGTEAYASSPYALSSFMAAQSSSIKEWVPLINRFNGELVLGESRFQFEGLGTHPSFFKTFGFSLEEGNAGDLNQPNVIFLTAGLARKIFPDGNALGQNLVWGGHQQALRVAGVLKEFPGKTHLEFDALTSVETLSAATGADAFGFDKNNWLDYYAGWHFYRLTDQADKSKIEAELNEVAQNRYSGLHLESRDAGYSFKLQPMDKITPGPLLSNSIGRGMPSVLLWFLSILGILIVASAGFNHANISLARAVNRAREIGIRKINGAGRLNIFSQFIVESILVALLSTALGILILQWLIPLFSRLDFLNSMDITLRMDWALYGWYLVFALVVGVLIGVLPAMMISRVAILPSIQKLSGLRILPQVSLRKAIITGQLAMTLVFFFLITTSYLQIRFALDTNFGAGQDYMVNLDLQGQEYLRVKTEMSKLPVVKSIAASSMLMGTYRDSKVDVKTKDTADALGVRDYVVDENFLPAFGLTLLNGKNFEPDPDQQHEKQVLVNESFLRFFNMGDPSEVVGKGIFLDTSLVSIAGVIRDFRFKPADYAIEPLVLRYIPEQFNILHLTLDRSADLQQAVASIRMSWAALDPGRPAQWSFYADDVKATYRSLRDILWIIAFFAALAASITLMGLLGMVTYILSGRRKEIAIRKVVGAGLDKLFWVLSGSFIRWLVLAVLISIPLASLLNNLWLQNYAYRVTWSPLWFVPGLALLTTAVLLIVGLQVLRAALSNPVSSLRNE